MAGDPHGFGAVVDYCRNAAIGQTASRIKKFSKCKRRRAILKLQKQSTVMGAGATRNLGFVPASVIRSLLPPSSGVLTHDHAPAFLPRLMVDSVVNHIVERTEKPVVQKRDRKRRRGMAGQLRRRRRRAAVRAFARETKKAEVERPIPVRGSIEGPWPFDIGQVITNEPEVVDLDYRIDSAEADETNTQELEDLLSVLARSLFARRLRFSPRSRQTLLSAGWAFGARLPHEGDPPSSTRVEHDRGELSACSASGRRIARGPATEQSEVLGPRSLCAWQKR
jgi:hypothetical protein